MSQARLPLTVNDAKTASGIAKDVVKSRAEQYADHKASDGNRAAEAGWFYVH
jgi:hypothetical protein